MNVDIMGLEEFGSVRLVRAYAGIQCPELFFGTNINICPALFDHVDFTVLIFN